MIKRIQLLVDTTDMTAEPRAKVSDDLPQTVRVCLQGISLAQIFSNFVPQVSAKELLEAANAAGYKLKLKK